MKVHRGVSLHTALPLPTFVLHPLTALVIATVHLYLSVGHLLKLIGGEVLWTHFWKSFGALAGAYVFAALASRGRVKRRRQDQRMSEDEPAQLST
jgi:hypothetical protein